MPLSVKKRAQSRFWSVWFLPPLSLARSAIALGAGSILSPQLLRQSLLENGAERYTPHSNSIEPPTLLIGWAPSGLRAADWPTKMHSRMISQPTQRSAERVNLTLSVSRGRIPYVKLILKNRFISANSALLVHMYSILITPCVYPESRTCADI